MLVSAQVDTHGCIDWFADTLEENLEHVSRYPRGQADLYMPAITNRTQPQNYSRNFPVIATAANSGFYAVSQGLLKSIYEKVLPKYKSIKVVYYDMGLTEHQRKQVNYSHVRLHSHSMNISRIFLITR